MAIFSNVFKSMSPELPTELGNMDQHLDFVLKRVIPHGQDLNEEKNWIGKRWKEVRDDEGFHEAILHIFNPGGEYLLSFDGNIVKGGWKRLGGYNTLILEVGGRGELFDLRFLNSDFLVLTKHGDQTRKGQRRYFFLVHEPAIKNLDWRQLMEKMFNVYREESTGLTSWVIFILLVAIILYMSLS
jgi:hypothetical protein